MRERYFLRGALLINTTDKSALHTVTSCTFDGSGLSSATDRAAGGGIHLAAGNLRVDGSTFTQLRATTGGALALTGSDTTAVVTSTTFALNNASWGGAVHVAEGRLTLSACLVSENRATRQGGGIFVGGGRVILSNTTYSISERTQRT